MSEVVLRINGRDYRVRARDGEEDKLVRAGEIVEERCEKARAAMGTLSDTSLYFYAALMLADEMVDDEPSSPTAMTPADESASSEARSRVAALADRLESLAARLEDDRNGADG
ncbi:cell division protein ZapA [Sphingomicrobium sp. XHP0239]|uniref:cell division protein ZapA n=1 Tax=Sphingomicrobium maritimum TaxID=3133972 RepID=UPI0031CC73A7